MFWSKPLLSFVPTVMLSLILFLMGGMLVGCSDRTSSTETVILDTTYQPVITNKLAEVAPPTVIKELSKSLDQYQPQVRILSPQPNQLFSDTVVKVSLDVQDYPLFKDETLDMGPHLHFILDNEPYQAIYDISEPITLENLSPGTHTLRVFAARPWHESFKNDGAYAQTTFHVFTQTEDNSPDPNLPLLTYSRPKGNYGAEPILLDFYLTNAPLHIYKPDEEPDTPSDWRIRVTINGESFLLDSWQPIYLTGFEKGGNWVKLEFLDAQGNPVKNAFNDTARLITYTPNGTDTLSQLVRGELSAEMARSIVNANAPIITAPPVEPSVEEETPEIVEETTETGEEIEAPEELETPEELEESTTEKGEGIQVTEEPQPSPEINREIPESSSKLPLESSEVAPETELIQPSTPPVEIVPEIEPEPLISQPEEPVTPEKIKVESQPQPSSPVETLEPPKSSKIETSEELTEDISNLDATELQLKLLESIEKLEQKLEELPKTSIKIEVPDDAILSEETSLPEIEVTEQPSSDNLESLRGELQNRLQKWREMLKISQ